ncbi:RNA polymerase sigma factor SigM [Maioricimonas rarisocia]|uniref:RNA polymerase sigma factor SigM n=1 Tax=Maioricimonas rarisocia TaxID=2528026 RepID=A0A517Z6G9_9PLAN|nr:sigma-70 family RNA polymerase sigma factor [Maioricimonas rarisocia]QDU38074.1 RNA polymerase sigma factor SigM [Maioricimonas rarisocia]
MTENELVQGLRERDPAAIQQLNESWLPSIWRFVYVRVGRDQHLAEDIVSESVLALIRTAADPASEIRNLGGWLRSVATHKVNDHFRAVARVQHLIDKAGQTAATHIDDDPAADQEREERRADIRDVMDGLPDKHRMALEWKYVEKLSVGEIAARLKVTVKAAESTLFRARREFRERFSRKENRDPPDGAVAPVPAAQSSEQVNGEQFHGEQGDSDHGNGDQGSGEMPAESTGPSAHHQDGGTGMDAPVPVTTGNGTARS